MIMRSSFGPIKSGSGLFLKVVLVLLAIAAVVSLIRFPQTEGRAVNLDLVSIYTDPLIIYMFIATIPFFVVLYQVYKLLNFIEVNRTHSKAAVTTLRNIKFASLSLIGFIVIAVFYIRFFVHGDDPAGPTALGIIVSFLCLVIALSASIFQKRFQKTINRK